MKKHITILVFILLITKSVYSGTDTVEVKLHSPPPFRFNVSSLWNVTLFNNSNAGINIYLIIIVSSGGKEIASAETSGIPIQPGIININASQFSKIKIDYNSKSGNFSEVVRSTGSFPAGNYKYCVTVRRFGSNEELGSECEKFEVQNISQVKIISPLNNIEVGELYPVFCWTQPTPVSALQNQSYIIKIYEVLSKQTPYNAVLSNPAFFQSPYINTTSYRYPAVSRNFDNNKRYAIQVSAYLKLDTGYALISQSEVKSFKYKNVSRLMTDSLFNNPKTQFSEKLKSSRNFDLFPESASHSNGEDQNFLDYGIIANIDIEAANKPGVYSELLKTYARLDLLPHISLFGVPFGANIFYTTDNSSDRQNMNNFAFEFDPNNLKEVVNYIVKKKMRNMQDEIERRVSKNGKESRETIESQTRESVMKKLSYPLRLFSQFSNLGVGDNYPQYTDYTLSGVEVSGLNLEFNPGKFFFAFTGPSNNRAVENTTFKRNLYSGRLGIGKYNGTHFYLTGMFARDDYSSIQVESDNIYLTPQENQLLGAEGMLSHLNDKLNISGEIAVSLFTEDTQAANAVINKIPKWIRKLVKTKVSSSLDFFYQLKTSYDLIETQTRLEAKMKMVGPGYISLGSPGKPNDLMEYEFSIDQKLMNDQISANISYCTDRDNLLAGFKSNTTYNSMLNININADFRNFPSIAINYYPAFMSNNASESIDKLNTINQNLSVIASYPVKILRETNNLSLQFGWNSIRNYKEINNSYNWNLSLTNEITFKNNLFFSGTFGLIKSVGFDTLNIYTLIMNSGITMFDVLKNSMGFSITATQGKNQNLIFYINSNVVFLKYFTLVARLEKSMFYDYEYPDFSNTNDLIFRSTLSMNLN
jgi:hypothetical protein